MTKKSENADRLSDTTIEWLFRWAIEIETGLHTLRMRAEIDRFMQAFTDEHPRLQALLVTGVLHDLVTTPDFAPVIEERLVPSSTPAIWRAPLTEESARLCELAARSPEDALRFLRSSNLAAARGSYEIGNEAIRWALSQVPGLPGGFLARSLCRLPQLN